MTTLAWSVAVAVFYVVVGVLLGYWFGRVSRDYPAPSESESEKRSL